jgi:hypothetical protein
MNPERRLLKVPWIAVVGEFTTTLCFGCSGLFVPFYYWSSWPELLVGWHFVVVVVGSVATAFALMRRKPASLKIAIVLAAYIGLPTLWNLSQAVGETVSSAISLAILASYVVFGLGMLGQVAVLLSCLSRLEPMQKTSCLSGAAAGIDGRI